MQRDGAARASRQLAGFGPRDRAARSPRTRSTPSARSSLRWTAELAAERGLPVQIHLSETEQEVEECLAAHGERPASYLDRLGLLGERTLLAHGVWLDRAELELIAERGATVVTNPVANMKLASAASSPIRRRARRRRGRRSAPTAPAPTTRSTCSPT